MAITAWRRGPGPFERTRHHESDRPADIRAQADRARDSQQWGTAADLYRKVLGLNPSDAPIWVQLGNVLKEFGAFESAEGAYQRALNLFLQRSMPGSNDAIADVYLQLGHLYKVQGKLPDAAMYYRRALAGKASSADARRELVGLGVSGELETRGAKKRPGIEGVGAPHDEEQSVMNREGTEASEDVIDEIADLEEDLRRMASFFETASGDEIERLHAETLERLQKEEGDIAELEGWVKQTRKP